MSLLVELHSGHHSSLYRLVSPGSGSISRLSIRLVGWFAMGGGKNLYMNFSFTVGFGHISSFLFFLSSSYPVAHNFLEGVLDSFSVFFFPFFFFLLFSLIPTYLPIYLSSLGCDGCDGMEWNGIMGGIMNEMDGDQDEDGDLRKVR